MIRLLCIYCTKGAVQVGLHKLGRRMDLSLNIAQDGGDATKPRNEGYLRRSRVVKLSVLVGAT